MKLSNLRPAWRKFQHLNSMQTVSQEEILLIIAETEASSNRTLLYLGNAAMFLLLTFCCQGG